MSRRQALNLLVEDLSVSLLATQRQLKIAERSIHSLSNPLSKRPAVQAALRDILDRFEQRHSELRRYHFGLENNLQLYRQKLAQLDNNGGATG